MKAYMKKISLLFSVAVPALIIALFLSSCHKKQDRTEGGIVFRTVTVEKKSKAASTVLLWKGSAEIMKAANNSDEEEEAQRLNQMIAGVIYEGEKDAVKALEKKHKDYLSSFNASSSDPESAEKAPARWEVVFTGRAASVNGRYISYELSDYSVTDGEQGESHLSCAVFDRQTGKEAALSDFINEEKRPELEKIIRETLVQDKEAVSYEALRREFLVSEVEITNNFYPDDFGLHFVYSAGEIAPASEGVQNVLVRWDVLSPLLNPEIMGE